MTEEKKINSFKKYIQSQENKLDEYYKLDDSFYKDEIEQLELSILLLKSILNIIENSISKDKIRDILEETQNEYEETLKVVNLKDVEKIDSTIFKGIQLEGKRNSLQELLESEE